MSHFLCHKTDPSWLSFFFFFFVLRRQRGGCFWFARLLRKKSAIVAEIPWSQLSANRLSVWNGWGTLTQTAGNCREDCCVQGEAEASLSLITLGFHWQLSDQVSCFCSCYVYCFSTTDLILGDIRKNRLCKMQFQFALCKISVQLCCLHLVYDHIYLHIFERFLTPPNVVCLSGLCLWWLIILRSKCIIIFPEGRQHLTSPLYFWDATRVFVQANPGTQRWWVFLFERQPKLCSPLVQNHNVWVRESKNRQTLAFIVTASHPPTLTSLNLSFHSDLLSSDYVEIHYEGGKPVLSKVTSSIVVTKNAMHLSCSGGGWFCISVSWYNASGCFLFCTVMHIVCEAQICFVSSSGNRLWNKKKTKQKGTGWEFL